MKKIPVLIKGDNIPSYQSDLASGADIRASIDSEIIIEPGQIQTIPTGIFVEIPDGYEIQVRPRSGLAFKHGLTVVNTPGTIDADYRGEIRVIMINHGKEPFTVTSGMRIAQLVLAPVVQAEFIHKPELSHTARGEQGFGHTGTH
jgi:dUTP pyrophosphatase